MCVCACVSCMSCRKLTPPLGHSRRFCQARCDAELAALLFSLSLSFWLDVPLELLLKKTSLPCYALRAGSGSGCGCGSPKVHFSFLFVSLFVLLLLLSSLSVSMFSPLVLCAYSLLRHALILPFSCCCCCCFSHSRSRLFRPYITHPCHIPFP